MADPAISSIFETPLDQAAEAAADAKAEAEIEAGLGVAHETVRAWLQHLGNGEVVLPPVA